jgi:hypothetical protein
MPGCFVEYNLLRNGYHDWWFPAIGLAGGVMGIAIFLLRKHIFHAKVSTAYAKISIAFALVWSVVAFWWTYSDYRALAAVYELGKYREVSGAIENFVKPYPGRPGEQFDVDGVHFAYSWSIVSPGFRNIGGDNILIRQGRMIRIRYIGNSIVRLETCSG